MSWLFTVLSSSGNPLSSFPANRHWQRPINEMFLPRHAEHKCIYTEGRWKSNDNRATAIMKSTLISVSSLFHDHAVCPEGWCFWKHFSVLILLLKRSDHSELKVWMWEFPHPYPKDLSRSSMTPPTGVDQVNQIKLRFESLRNTYN
jgi:hypothetical protein